MTLIKYVDCGRTSELTQLRNNYVVLQEVDADNALLGLVVLDKDGGGLTFSDKYFQ